MSKHAATLEIMCPYQRYQKAKSWGDVPLNPDSRTVCVCVCVCVCVRVYERVCMSVCVCMSVYRCVTVTYSAATQQLRSGAYPSSPTAGNHLSEVHRERCVCV